MKANERPKTHALAEQAADNGSTCPLTSDPARRAEANASTETIREHFPRGVAEPALRALVAAGLTRLEHLTTVTEQELLARHGMGPKAVRILGDALKLRGWSFKAK